MGYHHVDQYFLLSVSEREKRKKEAESLFEKIMAGIFLSVGKETDIYI